ncbi:hypothetical protein [Kribbella sp. NPDC050459]|uniref:hypothetical protein n=1 Tax=Kribbella sp. NPDC050459 TaxID=3155785 RepID=UPI0033F546E2
MRAIRILSVALVSLALAGCTVSSPPTFKVGIIADSGFRPAPDGFTFDNYGDTLDDGTVPSELTSADVRSLFGQSVCADAAIGKCDLIPQAQAWMDTMNQQMANGHCFGFSVGAQLIWQHKVNPDRYGATTIGGLAIDDNASLQRAIARAWVLQTFEYEQAQKITGTPKKILHTLTKVLRPHPAETYTVTIWKSDGTEGHAVTPYAVRYNGNGKYEVLIYDNNWPGESRSIAFDTYKDTWSYQASTDPNEADSLYHGNAHTKTISLFPNSPAQGTQPCPYCREAGQTGSTAGTTGATPTAMVHFLGRPSNHSHVTVTDQAGHRLGRVNGQVVNEIPGARHVFLTADRVRKHKLEPILYLPVDVAYTFTIDGSTLTAPDTESITIIGPRWHIAIKGITMHPGDKDILTVDPKTTTLTYRTTRAKSASIEASQSNTRGHYAFSVTGVSNQPGDTINLSIPPGRGSLIISTVGSPGTSSVNLKMTRSTQQGVQQFTHTAIPLTGGDTIDLQFADWTNPSQGIPLVTTHNGQQTRQTLTSHR